MNTGKLGMFPSFGKLGMGMYPRNLNPFFAHIIFLMKFNCIPK